MFSDAFDHYLRDFSLSPHASSFFFLFYFFFLSFVCLFVCLFVFWLWMLILCNYLYSTSKMEAEFMVVMSLHKDYINTYLGSCVNIFIFTGFKVNSLLSQN